MIVKPQGLLLWYKQPDITSFSALHPIKKSVGKGVKVGHAGTLDKAAEGLQLVLVGAFTKLNPIFSHLDKEYIATISFGVETTTLDLEGDVCKEADLPSFEAFQQALERFPLGVIEQAPPIYSAIHIKGKRAYQYAQAGQEIEMKLRPVTLHHVKVLEIQTTEDDRVQTARLSVACGGGFYVRSFARDLAYACHSVATLNHLLRIGIGNYHQQPWFFSHEDATCEPNLIASSLLSAQRALSGLANVHIVTVGQELEEAISQGKIQALAMILGDGTIKSEQPVFLLNGQGQLLAQAYRESADQWAYQFVVAAHA